MPTTCPTCISEELLPLGTGTDDGKLWRCQDCQFEWTTNALARVSPTVATFNEAKAKFPTVAALSDSQGARVEGLKTMFLKAHPEPSANVAPFWAHYQQVFSEQGLDLADPQDFKKFGNAQIGANPGQMTAFNNAWNKMDPQAAANKVRGAIRYLLYDPGSSTQEDRLSELIDPQSGLGMTGFREALLTKVLCVVEPQRFLPILTYSAPARESGKKEIAFAVFSLDLPRPNAVSWTRGRLAFWSNDLLLALVGGEFVNAQHKVAFLWWAKDQGALESAA